MVQLDHLSPLYEMLENRYVHICVLPSEQGRFYLNTKHNAKIIQFNAYASTSLPQHSQTM